MAEKTEKATPKKLRDARKKGQVAKSQDLPSAFTFMTSIWLVILLSSYLYNKVGGFIVSVFGMVAQPNLHTQLPSVMYEGISTIFTACFPIMLLVSFVGVVINFLSVGPVFSVEVFKPDIKKFDPVKNLKAKFKLKTLFELAKSIFKVAIAAYLIYGVMYKSLPVLIKTVSMDAADAVIIFHTFLLEVVIKVGLFFVAVAVLDFVFQKKNFAKEMKMEKFEVKQEFKNTEGDPMIKSKRKQFAQEIAYQEGPAAGVQRAKAVVTNPTHLAIVIGYEKEYDPAPFVLLMGQDAMAARLVMLAEKFGVPVVRNIKLAHRLWEDGEQYDFIPEDTYEVMSEILRWVSALGSESEYEYSADSVYWESD